MSKTTPDWHDADLVVRLYDLRREAVMRKSRDAMNARFMPRTYEDFLAVTKPEHPDNAAFRQVSTYWEMVYAMARHGVVNAEYFVESNREGMLLYTKVQPFVARFRQESSPTAFRNAEWVATQTDVGRATFAMFEKRLRPS
ncbi:MAG TPA: hypothetical protein VFY71_05460 [Planctomycetota bacterium]|nr:hypothetical protein [Planctomycetota bacterium]